MTIAGTLIIPSDFGYVGLAAAGTLIYYTALGFSVNGARKKYRVPPPDMGSGIYASKLDEKDWVAFNNVMRSHLNLSEQLPSYLTLLLIGGLHYPRAAAGAGALFTTGRIIYARGYIGSGPEGRRAGAMISMASIASLLGMTIWGSAKLVGLV
ncbi:microsomal glutathione S-transferase 3 [Thamnocephalis sphaerospora]|uniref:Microsomal glutathione S-transferase 3 n=1 Tax=Thamnocephalis sphaerospora TaxID=78915 RepID=A0A4P9XPI4_9FUNG|nr:microsomal glutathione S-transferase 3 [Thamnocephalis sphaerospora]|eukprot:RKP07917.1 microsomal glutathione S-transferase 3 [Thamnocephalis sphaerospora]